MQEGVKTFFTSVFKATFLTVIVSLVGVLFFSLVVKFADISDTVIKVVNQFIKIIAVFLGCYFSFSGSKGLIKGVAAGLVSCALLYLIFSLLSGTELLNLKTLIDLLFVATVGGISGVIAVNMKGKE